MIENLKGVHETVNFKENTNIRLYDNDKTEDYPIHWHTPLEIIMPLENDYTIIHNHHMITLHPKEIIYISSGALHTLKAPPHGRRIIFQAECALLHKIKELESILSFLPSILVITPETLPSIHDKLYALMLEIRDEYFTDSALTEASIYARLLEIFVLIGRNHTQNFETFESSTAKQKEYTEKFLSICGYINDHCTEDLTLDYVSGLAGFSKYHFTRLFKQFTNVSFYKYVNQKRIAYAEILLIDPQMSITEVALHSGFSSPSAFIRMFKMLKSCTPTEFRHMYHL